MNEPEMHQPAFVTDGGPWAFHDYACPCCQRRKAVIDIGTGVFQPCGECQRQGYAVVRLPRFLRRWWWRFRWPPPPRPSCP